MVERVGLMRTHATEESAVLIIIVRSSEAGSADLDSDDALSSDTASSAAAAVADNDGDDGDMRRCVNARCLSVTYSFSVKLHLRRKRTNEQTDRETNAQTTNTSYRIWCMLAVKCDTWRQYF